MIMLFFCTSTAGAYAGHKDGGMFVFCTPQWNLHAVEKCLENYRELLEAYRTSFIGSSLRTAGETVSAGGSRTYPARVDLLTSKWDIDRGLAMLPERDQAVFCLRYVARRNQSSIASYLDLSQQHVSRLIRSLPAKILRALVTRPAEKK